jgi:hypothetical protein
MRWLQLCLLGTVASAMVVFTAQAQQQTRQQPAGQQAAGGQAAPRHSIKDVMENAHKAGLLKKVLDGQASQEEKMTLLDHYVSLTESAPPQGSPEGWQAKANAVVVAAAKVATGRDDGTELLKGATNCAACHKEHKPATN